MNMNRRVRSEVKAKSEGGWSGPGEESLQIGLTKPFGSLACSFRTSKNYISGPRSYYNMVHVNTCSIMTMMLLTNDNELPAFVLEAFGMILRETTESSEY